MWAVREPPLCRACPKTAQLHGLGVVTQTAIRRQDELSARSCRSLGIAPGAILTVEDGVSFGARAVRIAGTVDDLFTRLRRAPSAPNDDTRDDVDAVATDP